MSEFYNLLLDVPIWVFALLTAILAALIRQNLAARSRFHAIDLMENFDRGFFGHDSTDRIYRLERPKPPKPPKRSRRCWAAVWLVAQIVAVTVTIIGFGLQIGVYVGWLPESL